MSDEIKETMTREDYLLQVAPEHCQTIGAHTELMTHDEYLRRYVTPNVG